MSFLDKLIPKATSYVKSYFWLYMAGIMLPNIVAKLYLIRDGKMAFEGLDAWIITLEIFIPCISGTLAYVDKHNKGDEK